MYCLLSRLGNWQVKGHLVKGHLVDPSRLPGCHLVHVVRNCNLCGIYQGLYWKLHTHNNRGVFSQCGQVTGYHSPIARFVFESKVMTFGVYNIEWAIG